MKKQTIKDVQSKILEIMLFIDNICRENKIVYHIMGGTALGAIRHGGFIPWDDDLDIFMTPKNYYKFKEAFNKLKNDKFIIQEWKIVEEYLEYAKVRMNGTTFIEESFKDEKDMHHGIYVDIMILHKCPEELWKQKLLYLQSRFVTVYALSKRNWKPKSTAQSIIVKLLKYMPSKLISKLCYKNIYKYDNLQDNYKWCYFITPAKFNQAIFDRHVFEEFMDIEFEGHNLHGSKHIKEYLECRYGDYMKLPSKKEQDDSVHAMIYDVENGYEKYLNEMTL